MNKEIMAFRMILAEQGTEMTPKQAKKAYESAKSIVQTSKKMSMIDLWNLRDCEMEGLSDKERKDLADLYRNAKDI